MPNATARLVANAFAALLAAACFCGAAWFITGTLGPDGTWTDVLGTLACMAGFLGAGALAIPRKFKEPTA
jgi:hypothetical protein